MAERGEDPAEWLKKTMSEPETEYMKKCRQFEPSNAELIGYLKRRILGENLGSVPILELMEMYGKEKRLNPWVLFGGDHLQWRMVDGKPSLFFFTSLSCVGKTSLSLNKQKNRVAGDGSWKVNKKEHQLLRVSGIIRKLSFKSKSTQKDVGVHWNVDEFALDPAVYPQGYDQGLVLCRLRRPELPSKKRKRMPEDEDESCVSDDDASSTKRHKIQVTSSLVDDSVLEPYFVDMPPTDFVNEVINFDYLE